MSTKQCELMVNGIPVKVVRKDIKNLHLGVYPPDGRVRIAVPLWLDDEAVRLAIVSRLGWIRRKQAGFREQIRESKREMVTGESHYVEGRRFRLVVVEEERQYPIVRFKNNKTIEMRVPPGTGRDARERALERWYRRRLRERIPSLLQKWEPRIGVKVNEIRIKKMKTLWGSCNDDARRIWLNLELAKKPSGCQEYILVHEMVHIVERHHTDRFAELMDQFLPNWKMLREELNRAPLSHAEWRY